MANSRTLIEVPNDKLKQGSEYLVEYNSKCFCGVFDSCITVEGETPKTERLVFDTGTPLGKTDEHVMVFGKLTRCFALGE